MGEAGFEPAKAWSPRFYRPRPLAAWILPRPAVRFYGGIGAPIDEMLNRLRCVDFEFRVLLASECNAGLGFDRARGNEPAPAISGQCEYVVAAGPIEGLCDPAPALITAIRRKGNRPARVAIRCPGSTGRRLHLDPKEVAIKLADEVRIWAVAEGRPDRGALARQPL